LHPSGEIFTFYKNERVMSSCAHGISLFSKLFISKSGGQQTCSFLGFSTGFYHLQ